MSVRGQMRSSWKFMRVLFVSAAGLAVLLSPAMSHGQSYRVNVGDKIRLKTPRVQKHFYGERTHESSWITGIVMSLDGRFLRLKLAETQETVSVRRDSIASMEKSLGFRTRKSGGKFIGMVTGAVVGAGVGVAIAYIPCAGAPPGSSDDKLGCASLAGVLGITGFVVGGWGGRKLGGKIGEGIKYEKWERLRGWGGELSLSLGSVVGGSELGASLAFRF